MRPQAGAHLRSARIVEYFVILALLKFGHRVGMMKAHNPCNCLDRGSIMVVPVVYALVVLSFIMWLPK